MSASHFKRPIILTLGTRGDVQPFLLLARELLRRGAAPLLMASGHFAPLAREAQVPMASILEGDAVWKMDSKEASPQKAADIFHASLARHMSAMLRQIERVASEHRADVVVVGSVIWTIAWLRRTLQLPLVHVFLQPARWLDSLRGPTRVTVTDAFRRSAIHPEIDPDYVAARAEHCGELHLLAYPDDLGVTHLPQHQGVCTGFWVAPQPPTSKVPPSLAAFLQIQPAPVCLNFGSMDVYSATWMPPLLQTLRQLLQDGCRLLVIGDLAPQAVRDWPRTLWVPSAPHAAVFPHCVAIIHHGGAGTSAAAITAARPSVVVPHLTWIVRRCLSSLSNLIAMPRASHLARKDELLPI